MYAIKNYSFLTNGANQHFVEFWLYNRVCGMKVSICNYQYTIFEREGGQEDCDKLLNSFLKDNDKLTDL